MAVQGLLRMIKKFQKTDSFDVQSGRGRRINDSKIIEKVATAVQEESSCNVKPCCARGIAEHRRS